MDELPGASSPCIGAVASPVFGKPPVKVGSGPDVEFPRSNALQDVKMGHGKFRLVGPSGLEPLTFPASRDALAVVGPSGLEPLTFPASRDALAVVGPSGLEPLTSTVSILKMTMALMSRNSVSLSIHADLKAPKECFAYRAYSRLRGHIGLVTSQTTSQNGAQFSALRFGLSRSTARKYSHKRIDQSRGVCYMMQ